MKRRTNVDVSSLDMLLDTVCNTFGGICFIALLVSIISANLPMGEGEKSDAQIKVIEQDMRLENLTRERDTLLAALKIQESTLTHKATTPAASVISEKLSNLVNDKDEAAALETSLQRKLAELLSDNARLAAETQQAGRELERLKALNEELKSKEDKAKKSTEQVVRLPMEHSTSRKPFHIFIVKNRIYPLFDTTYGNRENTEHCTFTELGSGETVVRTRPGAGIPIPADPRNMPYFAEMVQRLSDDRFLNVYVDADSFAAFCKIRNLMITSGIPYNWEKFEDPMLFVPADSFSVQ